MAIWIWINIESVWNVSGKKGSSQRTMYKEEHSEGEENINHDQAKDKGKR